MNNIQNIFNQYFSRWQITLPEKNLQERQKGSIFQSGWRINFIFGIEDNVEYLEYYAMHRMTNDRHTVIYENGEIKHLECLNPPLEYSSPNDERQSEHNENNRRVKEALINKSLL